MIAVAERQIDDVEASLCREWRSVRDSGALAYALAAEHMRALMYGNAIAHQGNGAAPSIRTLRLLTGARRAVELVWPHYAHEATAPDTCSIALGQMKALGDVVDVGSGQWIATPLRIIAAKEGTRYLLTGTAPAPVAHRRFGAPPICAGTSRYIEAAELRTSGNDDLVASFDDWLGHQQPLMVWTAQVIAQHEARMESVEGASAEHLELYAPDVSRTQRRTGRWIAAGEIGRPIEGPRLCRPQDRYAKSWDRPLYLAHFGFKSGALALRRTALVAHGITLRLRFGLDVMLQTPRRAAITLQRETFSIDRPIALPEPETRIYALAWNQDRSDGQDRLIFHADAMPFVKHAFQRLAITPVMVS
jgi:hypothetical protein